MARNRRTHKVDAQGLLALEAPRTDLLTEIRLGESQNVFTQDHGPFEFWRRELHIEDPDSTPIRVTETIHFKLAVRHIWRFYVHGLIRARLRFSNERQLRPFWAPSQQMDTRSAGILGLLASVAVLTGYLGTLVSQTMTFAAEDFGSTVAQQGRALAAIRLGVVISLAAVWIADRIGRRRVLVFCAVAGVLLSTTGAFAPSLAWLTLSQTIARPFATAMFILLAVIAVEELPAGSRAYGMSLLSMASAFGAAITLMALRLADEPVNNWRIIYLLPLLGLPIAVSLKRHLPESKRFLSNKGDGPKWYPGHRGTLFKLCIVGFLIAILIAPAAQLRNEFLNDEQGFSAGQITLFVLTTSTPAGLGVLMGGQLSDTRGRRKMASLTLALGSIGIGVAFLTSGPTLWVLTLVASFILAMAGPGLTSYGPELFPTAMRARANSIISVVGTAGSACGLLMAAELSGLVGGLGKALAIMAIGPVIASIIIWRSYPETARRALEDINPEDHLVATDP